MSYLVSVCVTFLFLFSRSQPAAEYNETLYKRFSTLENLLQVVSQVPHQYILNVHSTVLAGTLTQKPLYFSFCFPCRLKIFSTNYKRRTNYLNISQANYRFTQPFQVILAEYYNPQVFKSFRTFSTLAMSTSTIFFHFHVGPVTQLLFKPYHLVTTAMKVIITLHHGKEHYLLMCLKYCGMWKVINTSTITHMLMEPVRFHRKYFWSGYGHTTFVHAPFSDPILLNQVNTRDSQICTKNVGTASNNKISVLCSKDLLTLATVSSQHNLTFHIFNPMSIEMTQRHISTETILYNNAPELFNEAKKYEFVTNRFFAESGEMFPLYCVTSNTTSGSYQVWVTPFHLDVWVPLLTTLLVIILLHKPDSFQAFLSECYNMICLVLGQALQLPFSVRKNQIFIFVIFFVFLLRSVYENMITSILIVPQEPLLYSSLRDMILDNVKLVRFNDSFTVEYDVLLKSLEPDFRRAGVLNKLSSTIINISEPYGGETFVKYFAMSKDIKYAALVKRNRLVEYVVTMVLMNNTQDRRSSCHMLQQAGVMKTFGFWHIAHLNHLWLITTLGRLRSAGLCIIWDKWRYHLSTLVTKKEFKKQEQNFLDIPSYDIIDFDNVFSISVLCCTVYGICIVLFCVEVKLKHYRLGVDEVQLTYNHDRWM